jgi:transposase
MRRKWTVDEKVKIVLEGLKNPETLAHICREYGVNQNLFYKWKKRFRKKSSSLEW